MTESALKLDDVVESQTTVKGLEAGLISDNNLELDLNDRYAIASLAGRYSNSNNVLSNSNYKLARTLLTVEGNNLTCPSYN